jgi:hypothetical protein
MAKLTVVIENHSEGSTVSEMRHQLARVLSKLDGGQEVSFTFRATLDTYRPAPSAHQIEAEENRYPCDCQSAPHHFQCNAVRKAYVVMGPLARPEND